MDANEILDDWIYNWIAPLGGIALQISIKTMDQLMIQICSTGTTNFFQKVIQDSNFPFSSTFLPGTCPCLPVPVLPSTVHV